MKIWNLLCGALLAIGMVACSDKQDEPDTSWGNGITVKSEVTLSGTAAQPLNIKAPTAPSLSTDATWLHIGAVQSVSTGIYSAELSADINLTPETRTAIVTVTAGSETATVKVTQQPGDYVAIITTDGTLLPGGGELAVEFTATGSVQYTFPEWMSLVELDETASVLKLKYGPNVGAPRTGEVVISVGKDASGVLAVSQDSFTMPNEMGSTAAQLAAKMYAGINIGNTMECPGKEGDWSMPVNETYVGALAAMGFKAVRIPCAWDSHVSDAATNTIDPAWLDRVDEVVGYVIANGMYAVLNIHWDGGWLENNLNSGWDAAIDKKQRDYWKQIAEKLNHYNEHLLLAAMNEPDGTTTAGVDAIMKYQQAMLDVVRATGGNNATRVLVMQVPQTNIDLGCSGDFHMPTDVVADRLMVEAHFYDPYQFNMMQTDANWGKVWWYWGEANLVAGSDRNATHTAEDVRTQMQKLKSKFVDAGYPAIIGEYCVCEDRSSQSGIDKAKHQASLHDWNLVVTREAKNAGCVPFFWETGGDINRLDGSVRRTYQLDGLFKGAAEGQYPF